MIFILKKINDKKKIKKKDNIINFPTKLSSVEKEIEAIVFAAAEPLDIEYD